MFNVDRVSLKHLLCFVETYHMHSLVEASRSLGITQSAASRRITDLEEALGVKLFEREGRKLRPNTSATLLLGYAEAAILKLRTGLSLVSGAEGEARPELLIGALPTVAGTLMPQAVQELWRALPNFLIRIETGSGERLMPMLRSGAVDVVVGRMPDPSAMEGLTFTPMYSDHLAYVARCDHPLLGQGVRLADLQPYPMILPQEGAVIRPVVERFLMARGLGLPHNRIETTSAAVAIPIVQGSDAVWVISRGVAEAAIRRNEVAVLDIDTSETIGSIGLTWRDEAEVPPKLTMLLDILKSKAAASQGV